MKKQRGSIGVPTGGMEWYDWMLFIIAVIFFGFAIISLIGIVE